MSDKENNRSEWLHIRLTNEELKKINEQFAKSVCRKLSEYARKKLLDKPITIRYRNQSFDEFVNEMILLRNELSAIGNNFNQLVKRLNTAHDSPEIKLLAEANEMHKEKFFQKVDEIKERIGKLSDKWSQESTATGASQRH